MTATAQAVLPVLPEWAAWASVAAALLTALANSVLTTVNLRTSRGMARDAQASQANLAKEEREARLLLERAKMRSARREREVDGVLAWVRRELVGQQAMRNAILQHDQESAARVIGTMRVDPPAIAVAPVRSPELREAWERLALNYMQVHNLLVLGPEAVIALPVERYDASAQAFLEAALEVERRAEEFIFAD